MRTFMTRTSMVAAVAVFAGVLPVDDGRSMGLPDDSSCVDKECRFLQHAC
jgi:hypothetical protein